MVNDIGVGDIVRHFKGRLYKVIGFGTHSETKEQEVIYQALYPPFTIWVRPKGMFLSEVDKEKYPNCKQKYRFEVMTDSDLCFAAADERYRNYFRQKDY